LENFVTRASTMALMERRWKFASADGEPPRWKSTVAFSSSSPV